MSSARLFSRALVNISSKPSNICLHSRYCSEATVKLGSIDFESVKTGLDKKSLTYIDVRNRSELQKDGMIVGSFNIPLPEVTNAFAMSPEDFKQKYGFSMPEKSADNIIVGCLFAIRSKEAGLFLQKIGYKTIRIYNGGFNEWKAKDGPISK
ncbi:rhodanese domain-containing protein CG4456-like [Daphnia pulicaria]|uniref:rhodanese domain-containing protein CG4456-like n=1 Tax=Daphnia pulicaria TaxID=35523 RepID=UPI001EEC7143|nr:rhodanese domain-containing protein CG4456-like [Daphnia pulicaria]